MPRRATKIVATLGPASSDPALLEQMIRAGVNVVRLNFSHGKAQDHIDRARLVREAAHRAGREVAIMADLQGPKIRVGKFAEGKVFLEPGQKFVLDAARTELGDIDAVGLDYKALPREVKAGDVLLLNDGLIVITVDAVKGEAIYTTVKLGGELSNNKGINKQGGGLSAPALTAKDMEDIRPAMSFQADYGAVSFPENATAMALARRPPLPAAYRSTCGSAAAIRCRSMRSATARCSPPPAGSRASTTSTRNSPPATRISPPTWTPTGRSSPPVGGREGPRARRGSSRGAEKSALSHWCPVGGLRSGGLECDFGAAILAPSGPRLLNFRGFAGRVARSPVPQPHSCAQ